MNSVTNICDHAKLIMNSAMNVANTACIPYYIHVS